jgi:hypothetical protein
MTNSTSLRLRQARRFALKHLAASALIAALCAGLVFGVWFPYPYDQLAGGRELFTIVVTVDVVIGPLLSLVVYNPAKPRRELWRDLGTVFLLQTAALGYGLHSVAQARPVYLAFEADRFRVVAIPDIDLDKLNEAPPALQSLSWTGPKPLGVRLLSNTDPEFPQSIQLALQGIHPSFRPTRWVDFESQRSQVTAAARPLLELKRKQPSEAALIEREVAKRGLKESDLGYLPLSSQHRTDWSVLVDLKDGEPRLLLHVDAW